MAKYMLAITVSALLSAGAASVPLKEWKEELPELASDVVTGIEKVFGTAPSVEASISQVGEPGAEPKFQAALRISEGNFSSPIGEVSFSLPAAAETVLQYGEAVSGERPAIAISATLSQETV